MIVIWIAGGASRGDAIGQPIVRSLATVILAVYLFFAPSVRVKVARTPLILACLTIALVALQLVPLPPAIWTALPGHGLLAGASAVVGDPLPWRPISVSPSWTVNALGSLVVPFAMLVLASGADRDAHERLLGVLVILSALGASLGLIQTSGGKFDHPFINDIPGMVSGNLANRNHFALYLAISLVIAWLWATLPNAKRWRQAAAAGMTGFFAVLILATGSRAGIVLLALAGTASTGLAVRSLNFAFLRRHARLATLGLAGLLVIFAVAASLSHSLDRAESLNRIVAGDGLVDIRVRLVPMTLELATHYLPFGSGFGTFDPVFRISEPTDMLGPAYYNHAHSDLVELFLEGGLAAACLFTALLVWVVGACWRSWSRRDNSPSQRFSRAGTAVMLLVIVASATDYPARTPLIMSLFVLGVIWASPPWKEPRRAKERPGPLNSPDEKVMAGTTWPPFDQPF